MLAPRKGIRVSVDSSSTPAFVSELVRAANEVERLGVPEYQNLLYRAITTVNDLREQVGIPGSGTAHDAIVDLEETADSVASLGVAERASALLDAADMVRTLWIVFDSNTRIVLTPG